jgi:1,4-alpha-glucan branching enzyme
MKKTGRIKKKKVMFRFHADPGKKIFIAGTFNAWGPKKSRLKEIGAGEYRATLLLPAGRHEYKFIVDDEWSVDLQNPEIIPNDHGSTNNVIIVE